jgi:Spy/CpxP family protein refolding chaperone
MQRMRDTVEPLMTAAWSELAKPDADQATAARLFDEAGQARRSLQRELLAPTLSFLATLSPEQRAKFVELFHQRPRSWGNRRNAGLISRGCSRGCSLTAPDISTDRKTSTRVSFVGE